MKLLDEEDQRLSDPQEIRKTRGVPAYLHALATQPVRLPAYWTTQHPGTNLQDWGDGKPVQVMLEQS